MADTKTASPERADLPRIEHTPDAPEFGLEQQPAPDALGQQTSETALTDTPSYTIPTAPALPVAIPIVKDELTHQIEKVLEEDLSEVYFQMGPEQQNKFKIEGEYVTATLRQMIKSGVVKLKRVLSLILHWLKMIPGVNQFFLEKEAKIKAEKILALREEFL